MSVIQCDLCERFVDSDEDPACFCELPDYAPFDKRGVVLSVVMCEPCREAEHDKYQAAMEAGPQ